MKRLIVKWEKYECEYFHYQSEHTTIFASQKKFYLNNPFGSVFLIISEIYDTDVAAFD